MPGLVLTAAGASTRFGDGPNKVLSPLAGVPLLARAAEAFRAAFPGLPIVVTVRPEDRAAVEALAASDPRLLGAIVIEGGATRQESVRQGLAALPETVGVALVHDAARPLVPPEVVERVLAPLSEGWDAVVPALPIPDTVKRVEGDAVVETLDRGGLVHDAARPLVTRDLVRRVAGAAERDGAAAPALPVTDSVHRVDDDDRLVESYARDSLRAVQTPQAAKAVLLRRAFAEAERRGFQATDEVTLLLAIGVAVTAVPGDPENLKITLPDDMRRAEEILARR